MFNNCILDEFQPGEGNLIGIDPWFDEELGAPFLSSFSPSIDAGDPDPQWNDREDSEIPGQALWPSQGGLRNDIGYMGGPHAVVIDTSWVALQRPNPRPALPASLKLLSPFPKPFNLATRIPFELTRGGPVTLRVYNLQGQLVQKLLNQVMSPGAHQVSFNGQNLASGVYIIQIQSHNETAWRKVLLLK